MEVLLIAILSNSISDFIFQTKDIVDGRKNNDSEIRKKANFNHFIQTWSTLLIMCLILFTNKNQAKDLYVNTLME